MSGSRLHSKGIVTGLDHSGITVEVNRTGGCAACIQRSGCVQASVTDSARIVLPRALLTDAAEGATVGISIRSGVLGRLVLLAYLVIPLLMLAGAWLGGSLGGPVAEVAGALVGVGLGCTGLRLYHSRGLAAGCLRALSVSSGSH